MDKYIKAELHHLRIGQVVEILTYHGQLKRKEWQRIEITNFTLLEYACDRYTDHNDSIRIPTIQHEDIVELGWELMYKDQYRLGLWHMEYNEDREIFIICIRGMDEYEIALQTKLDLADLMRMMGIKSE